MNRARRQHQVAQTYLRNFADSDGRLDVYYRATGQTLPRQNVRDVAVDSDLYTFVDEDGNLSDSFEQGPLARFDGLAARLLPALLKPKPKLSTKDRVGIDLFITLQFMRTRAMRNLLADTIDFSLRSELEKITTGAAPEQIEQIIKNRYPQASEKEREELTRIALDLSQPISFDTLDWLGAMVTNLSAVADFVIVRPWVFLETDGDTFLSCDNPIVLIGPVPIGLGTASTIYWPLSPSRALMRPPGVSKDRKPFATSPATRDEVVRLNQFTADQATQHVYWRPNTYPADSIKLPTGPLLHEVNGIPVAPGERSYDKRRQAIQAQRARRFITKRQ